MFQLHANGWRFAPGHTVKLELLGRDTPYGRASNGTFSVKVSSLEVRLPVRERPGALGGLVAPARAVRSAQGRRQGAVGPAAVGPLPAGADRGARQTSVRDNVRTMPAVQETTTVAEVGPRIRALREAMDLSLRDLAERSGVSAPMLSQVERGETSPTLTVAARIAGGLELRLSQLLRLDEGGSVTVVRADERRGGGSAGHRYELLTPPLPGLRAEVSRHVLAPGASTGGPGDPPMHEPGSRETAIVERGHAVLVCDGERHGLDTGDCVTFDADLPHHFENPGRGEAALLAVVSAGLRRS